jgi:hypothetical protein
MFIALIWAVIFGAICFGITQNQPRNSLTWFMLGFIFGPFAILFLLFSSLKNKIK